MPNPATPNMALILPTENDDDGDWDILINNALGPTGVDGHDHSPGKGVRVPSGGLNINADVQWASGGVFRAITEAKAFALRAHAAADVTSYTRAWWSDSAGNVFWRNSGGSNVQITNGASLNASLIGGIGGDYGAVGALVDFTDSTDTYRFRQQLGGGVQQYAKVAMADLDLFEFKAQPAAGVPANRVRIKSPAALGASYDVTMLTALPGSTSALQVDSAGQMTASNTFANAVTLTGGIANNVTLTLGATAASNQHVTVQGTGRHKHGTMTLSVAPTLFVPRLGANPVNYSNGTGTTGVSAVGLDAIAPVVLSVGHRIINIRFHVVDNATGTTTVSAFLRSVNSAGADSLVASATSAGNGTAQTLTLSAVNVTIASAVSYNLYVAASGAQLCSLRLAEIDYDLP